MGLTTAKIQEIEYRWNKITSISTIIWWDEITNWKLIKKLWFRKWIYWLFWKEENDITYEGIMNYFKTIKVKEEESYNYWIKLNQKELKAIEYKWSKIASICTISWWNNPNKLSLKTLSWFKEWINRLFDKETLKKQD